MRNAALVALLIGAAGSLGFMFYVGRRNRSVVLVALFTVWVLSPFVALAWGLVVALRWQAFPRALVYGLALVLALGSAAFYARVALGPPRAQPAFTFLVVPLASWLVMAAGALISFLMRGRPIGGRQGT